MVDDSKAAYRKQKTPDLHLFNINIKTIKKTPNEAEALNILDQIGIPTPKRAICSTHDEALTAFAKLNKPCVVKVLDKSIKHKTEVGGVILGVKTEKQLLNAVKRIDKIKTETKKKYLQETAEQGLELIIGAVNDLEFWTNRFTWFRRNNSRGPWRCKHAFGANN